MYTLLSHNRLRANNKTNLYRDFKRRLFRLEQRSHILPVRSRVLTGIVVIIMIVHRHR